MYKGIFILYLVCFSLYILFSREPDFFDGETMPSTIYWLQDSASKKLIPKAVYKVGNHTYNIDARYVLRSLPEGKKIEIIYNPQHPERAMVFSWWGYWITWGEILTSTILLVVLFQVAVSVTKNPTAESLLEQLEYKEEKKKKYIE